MNATKSHRARNAGIERVLRVAKYLQTLRFGATAEMIRNEIEEQMGERWHARTFRRDLQTLERVGFVRSVRRGIEYSFAWIENKNRF